MEEPPQLSTWERSTTRRLLRWLFSGRTLRRGLIALAWLVSLAALCYGVTDWRARRAWKTYRETYEAHAGPLALEAYVPKEVPAAENFAATPFVQSWMQRGASNFLFDSDALDKAENLLSGPGLLRKGQKYEENFDDLAALRDAFDLARSGDASPKNQTSPGTNRSRQKPKLEVPPGPLDLASRAQAAPTVLEGMKDDAAALEELRAASARPEARYPIQYKMDDPAAVLLPHLLRVRQSCARLRTRACAELALGQNGKALQDVKLILYLADSFKDEPFLISYLVRVACIQIALRPIWEGLAEHQWTEAQLQELQARLESYNFVGDLDKALRAERAIGVRIIDLAKQRGLIWAYNQGDAAPVMNSPQRFVQNLAGLIVPSGWYDQEKLHYCQGFDSLFQGSMDVAAKRVFPQVIESNYLAWKGRTYRLRDALWFHNIIATFLLPSLAKVPLAAALAQVTGQAAIACALERYRLAEGHFPGDLQTLVPRFMAQLPNDMIERGPLHYRLLEDGRFVLYSVGWNEKDDGGISGRTQFDQTEGDWVWEYPAAPKKSANEAAPPTASR